MRISDLTTEAGLDVLCEITPFICNIIEDDTLRTELRNKIHLDENASVTEVYAAAIEKLSKLIPILLKTHRSDVYGAVGAINGKSEEAVAAQPMLKTMGEIRDIVKDKGFKDFFKSLRETGET